tara:strand:- start:980 stop:1492 length:513 start_codon:yes stop_codon:yes gene_type:complete
MSKFSRSKGQRGEREVAELLQKYLSTEVHRELSASRDGGCDIKITINEFTYFIEVKYHTKITQSIIGKWWDQAKEQAELQTDVVLNPVPVLIYRQTRWKEWECRLSWHHMLWQLGKTSVKARGNCNPHITMPITVLTDVMKAGRNQAISKGRMILTDNNDVDKTTLGRRP